MIRNSVVFLANFCDLLCSSDSVGYFLQNLAHCPRTTCISFTETVTWFCLKNLEIHAFGMMFFRVLSN